METYFLYSRVAGPRHYDYSKLQKSFQNAEFIILLFYFKSCIDRYMYFTKTVNTDQVKIYNKKIVLMSSNEEDKYKC